MTTLMYHGLCTDLAPPPPHREQGAALYDVPLCRFREHVRLLETSGRRVELDAQPGDADAVTLTFDDGEQSNLIAALDVLRPRAMPATFFVITSRIGAPGYLSFADLRALCAAGMRVGSHGHRHAILTSLDRAELRRELVESRDILQAGLSLNIDQFSVPRGYYDETVLEEARRAGYRTIFTSDLRPALPSCVGRVAVKASWSLRRFEQALAGERPAAEKGFELVKLAAKRLLGPARYDRLRGAVLPSRG